MLKILNYRALGAHGRKGVFVLEAMYTADHLLNKLDKCIFFVRNNLLHQWDIKCNHYTVFNQVSDLMIYVHKISCIFFFFQRGGQSV